jgi:hypothetical protein
VHSRAPTSHGECAFADQRAERSVDPRLVAQCPGVHFESDRVHDRLDGAECRDVFAVENVDGQAPCVAAESYDDAVPAWSRHSRSEAFGLATADTFDHGRPADGRRSGRE